MPGSVKYFTFGISCIPGPLARGMRTVVIMSAVEITLKKYKSLKINKLVN